MRLYVNKVALRRWGFAEIGEFLSILGQNSLNRLSAKRPRQAKRNKMDDAFFSAGPKTSEVPSGSHAAEHFFRTFVNTARVPVVRLSQRPTTNSFSPVRGIIQPTFKPKLLLMVCGDQRGGLFRRNVLIFSPYFANLAICHILALGQLGGFCMRGKLRTKWKMENVYCSPLGPPNISNLHLTTYGVGSLSNLTSRKTPNTQRAAALD